MVLKWNDIKYNSYDGFNEEIYTKGIDFIYVSGIESVVQAIIGEFKTPYGTVGSTKHSNYGSHLHKLIGMKTDFAKNELAYYVEEVVNKYIEYIDYQIKGLKINTNNLGFDFIAYDKDDSSIMLSERVYIG